MPCSFRFSDGICIGSEYKHQLCTPILISDREKNYGETDTTGGCDAYSNANDLLTKLNSYKDGDNYPSDWLKWKIGGGSYPVHAYGNTVTLALADGSFSTASSDWTASGNDYTQLVTDSVTLPTTGLTAPTGTDYTFLGWKDASGTMVTGQITPTADVTYTAVWGCKVTLDPKGGTYANNTLTG